MTSDVDDFNEENEPTLDDIINLLKNHDFNYVDLEDDPSLIDNYYTIGQLMYHIKEPLDITVMYEALKGMGIIGHYKGFTIPNNMDFTAFSKEIDEDGNEKILILYNPSFADEFSMMLNENEHFIENMKKENENQLGLLRTNEKFVSISVDSIGGSFKKNKIITISMVKLENGEERELMLWVDNNWNQEDIAIYTTPKHEGKKSNYEYLNIPLPGMTGAENSPYIPIRDVLRRVYAYTKDACLILDNKTTITMIKKLFEISDINEDHHIDNIITGFVELSRISKLQKGEYLSLRELLDEYGIISVANNYSYGKSLKMMAIAKEMMKN